MILGDPRNEEARMAERTLEEKPMPTIWRVPDELWELIESILQEHDPPRRTGRPRVNQRAVLNAVVFRLRTGCQWNQMPKEFPDDSTVHRAFQRWVKLGVLDRIWAALVEECEELGGVNWEWQAVDGAMGKARFGGTSSAPIPPTGARTG
jgi:transposase